MTGRRALDLDSLAVSDRFRLFNFTRRDDHVAYLWVLRAMDRLRAVHLVQVDSDQVAGALDELAELGKRLSELAAAFSDDVAQHALVNRKDDEWHNLMLSACPNQKLLEQIAQVRSAIHRYESLLVGAEVLVERSAEEHAAIAQHLVDGDVPAAKAALAENWTNGMRRLLADAGIKWERLA